MNASLDSSKNSKPRLAGESSHRKVNQLKKLILCLLCILCATVAFGQTPVEDKAQCYTTWDNIFLYLSFKVDCPDVQGKQSAPNADVTGDDCVLVYIDTGKNHAEAITPTTFLMAVSAAGGAQFSAGTEDGQLKPVSVHTFKYGTTVHGTLNNDDDIDNGYSVEVALPWTLLNAQPPQPGDMMSFNIVVRRNGWKPNDFASLAPRVVKEEDVRDPVKWANLVLAAFAFVATSGPEKVVSPRSIATPPVINGTIHDREWPKNSAFSVKLPMPAGFVYEAKFPIQRLLLAPYHYTLQRDPEKAAPYTKLTNPDGGIALQHFPDRNLGPWVSYDRVQWHKEQASDARAAGIDVFLPAYRGDAESRAGFAVKGLDCLIAALLELRAEGKPYPLIGMLFDCSSLEKAFAGKPAANAESTRRAFYGMVKDFFDRVPPELRACSQTGKPDAGRLAPLLFTMNESALGGIDTALIDHVNKRFQTDFGSPLIWVSSDKQASDLARPDGKAAYGEQAGPICDTESRIRICSVGAGYDDSAAPAESGPRIVSRLGGEVYEEAWAQAIAGSPHWVVCGSWNNFAQGTDLCASREFGRKYIDATQASSERLAEKEDFRSQYLRCSVPGLIVTRGITQAELTIRNVGSSPWRTSEGCALGYRWYLGGRYFGESKVRRILDKDVMPGETITLTIGLATVDMQGTALPEADYQVRFELIRASDNKWFSTLGDQPLIVPVTVGETKEWLAEYVSCDAPVIAASGHTYQAKVRVRNEGSKTWPKGAVKIGWKLVKVANFTQSTQELLESVPIVEKRVLLAADCKPGEVATFVVPLDFRQPNGKPLPTWRPEYPWSYQIRFDIHNGEKWLSELGSREICRTVGLFDSDYGARIVDSSLPQTLSAGQSHVAKVVVRNNGVQTWDRKKTRIGYHWYHLDGSRMEWNGALSPLEADLKPGWPGVVNAKVTAPEYDGQYVLVWDVMIDDLWLSTLPITRGGDILPVTVTVTGGKLVHADMTAAYNISATSPDTNRSSGDFDGKGLSFPAEYFPPDSGGTEPASRVYPSGYKWSQKDQPDGRISFLFADKSAGANNALACKSQKIVVDRGNYAALHIAAASSNLEAKGDLSINYGDGAVTAPLSVHDWSRPPAEQPVVCATRHRHSHGGDEVGKACFLYHYRIPLDSARTLTSVTVPENTDIKIAAMTLERASLPAVSSTAQPK